MRQILFSISLIVFLIGGTCLAQSEQKAVVDDFKPAINKSTR